ncbi:MAG TPA: amidase family protein, partial [Pyrinomonadaceae bacterium]|nr:amidase family protein [Pyrinomonadaceae bacterium]
AACATRPTLEGFLDAWCERDRLRAALLEWMERTPLIVTPVGAVTAFEHDAPRSFVAGEKRFGLFRAFGHAQGCNVFDLPAASVPAGLTREGLPVGVQIVGRPFDERTVLAAARAVEAATGGWRPPRLALSND